MTRKVPVLCVLCLAYCGCQQQEPGFRIEPQRVVLHPVTGETVELFGDAADCFERLVAGRNPSNVWIAVWSSTPLHRGRVRTFLEETRSSIPDGGSLPWEWAEYAADIRISFDLANREAFLQALEAASSDSDTASAYLATPWDGGLITDSTHQNVLDCADESRKDESR